jgi:hypothetical protein
MNIIKIIELLGIIIVGSILLLFFIVMVKIVKVKLKTTASWSEVLGTSYSFFKCKTTKMPTWCSWFNRREPPSTNPESSIYSTSASTQVS